jgi:hypothetical protein
MRGNRFFVPRRKLTKYLLNPNHEAGRAKARFLLSKGFSPKDPAALEQALIQHAREAAVCQIRPGAEGKGYLVSYLGPLHTPTGPVPRFMSVWYIEEGEATFVTAYPAGTRDRCYEATGA